MPEAAIRQLQNCFHPVEPGSRIFPGVEVVSLPGHTPGQAGLFLVDEKILLAGDGVKNAWEFCNRIAPPAFFSKAAALQSYDWARANAREIVPGHDRPFRLAPDGGVRYLTEASPVQLTLYPDPEAAPKKISLSGSIRGVAAATGMRTSRNPGR